MKSLGLLIGLAVIGLIVAFGFFIVYAFSGSHAGHVCNQKSCSRKTCCPSSLIHLDFSALNLLHDFAGTRHLNTIRSLLGRDEGRLDNTRQLKVNTIMLGWAITFLIIAIIAAVFGFGGIAAASAGIAKVLFFLFLVLCVTFLCSDRQAEEFHNSRGYSYGHAT
jgi:uncharacterized membrane protein YtjA (UPF0391 family)